jgi:LmbE family N-acetylglucosaminyl deacetylase
MHYQRILVVGAHPDDELRMAAAIAKMGAQGTEVTVLICTDGCEGYPRPDMKDSIVEIRAAECREAQNVLGVHRYVNLGAPDMGLVNTKENLKKIIAVIREVRPEALFTHGEKDRHRDHFAAHDLSIEAAWHAGEPVSAELGEPWKIPHLYYYKNTALEGPVIEYDATEYAYVVPLAYATQVSQHTLFRRTREDYLAEAERFRKNPPRTVHRFVLHPWTVLKHFPAV